VDAFDNREESKSDYESESNIQFSSISNQQQMVQSEKTNNNNNTTSNTDNNQDAAFLYCHPCRTEFAEPEPTFQDLFGLEEGDLAKVYAALEDEKAKGNELVIPPDPVSDPDPVIHPNPVDLDDTEFGGFEFDPEIMSALRHGLLDSDDNNNTNSNTADTNTHTFNHKNIDTDFAAAFGQDMQSEADKLYNKIQLDGIMDNNISNSDTSMNMTKDTLGTALTSPTFESAALEVEAGADADVDIDVNTEERILPQSQAQDRNMEEHHQQQQQHHQHQEEEYDHYPLEVSKRLEALVCATPILNAFHNKETNERQCYGHKSTVFGLSISPCGQYCATASQDSTVIVWDVNKNLQLIMFKGSPDHECLRVAWASDKWGALADSSSIGSSSGDGERLRRYPNDLILATAGADGVVTLHQSSDPTNRQKWKKVATLNHLEDINERLRIDTGNSPSEHAKSHVSPDQSALSSIQEESDKGTGDNKEVANEQDTEQEKKEEEKKGTEVYSLQFIDRWLGLPSFHGIGADADTNQRSSLGVLMTSSEDFIHIWQHCPLPLKLPLNAFEDCTELKKIMDIKFTHLDYGYGGVFVLLNSEGVDDSCEEHPDTNFTQAAQSSNIVTDKRCFGGDRNPENLVFVFDAVQCEANNLLGVALSDGTLRLVNGRGICVTILQLPGCQSHLTSFGWDKSGYRLASCVATGHVVLWDIDFGSGKGNVQPCCRAVLEGGHDSGRPLFGATFFGGEKEDLLVSWGVDGKICVWDSYSQGQIGTPISVLVSKGDYPIYAVDVFENHSRNGSSASADTKPLKSIIGAAGGTEGGFIGLPIYLYDYM